MENDTSIRILMDEYWYRNSRLANLDEIAKHTNSLNDVIEENQTLEKYCTEKVIRHVLSKPDLFSSKNSRNLVRTGVPYRYIKDFLLKLLGVDCSEESFKIKYDSVFKGHKTEFLGDFVPYFTGENTLERSLHHHYLTERGVLELKELMWMFNSLIPTIEFCPLIPKLTSIMLLFCTNYETYFIVKKLLETNYNLVTTQKLRWHIRFSYADHKKIIGSLLECLKTIGSSFTEAIFAHFDKIDFPIEKMLEDMIFGFFLDYLNFLAIIRLFNFFMLEGTKALYRIAFALFKTLSKDFLEVNSADQMIPFIRERARHITDLDKFFQLSYSFGLTRNNNQYDFVKPPAIDDFLGKRNSFYLPAFSNPSNIINEQEILRLWENFPLHFKISDAKLIFSSELHGYSLQNVYALCDGSNYKTNMMFLIETSEKDVFGGTMSQMFRHTEGKFETPLHSLLITFKPVFNIYYPNGEDVLYCDNNCVMFGNGKNGPALHIDNSLSQGYTYKDTIFGNPCLDAEGSGEFKILKFEIYLLS